MSYSEYTDLMPNDNIENGAEYIEALNWALNQGKIKNIALTGPYGSGKSSIIDSFLKQVGSNSFCESSKKIRESALKISMATFVTDEDRVNGKGYSKKIDICSEEIEKGILKQLFYKVEPEKIPQSRYRKLHKKNFWSVFINVFTGLMFLYLLSDIFAHSTYVSYETVIKSKLPDIISNVFGYYGAVIALFAIVAVVCSYAYISLSSKFNVREISFLYNTTISKETEESDSVFNKNLDEIMYFFEATGYRIVFFEDLDRLSDPKIFVHLRELNNLLNNDDVIKEKPIVFIYAVRDDIFSKEDRTKFFDFIIPVIPVINSTNSGEILLQKLQAAKKHGINHEISDSFVLDVAPYISDMRILNNIYNEYAIYKKMLRTVQELMLSDEQMLAMIVFKNLYPSDFADIQDERGIVKEAFEDKKKFIQLEKQGIQKKINDYENIILKAHKDVMKSVKDIKNAMLVTLMGGLYEFKGFGDYYRIYISESDIMSDDYDMTLLLKGNYGKIKHTRGDVDVDKEVLESYVERWKYIKCYEEKGIKRLQDDLQLMRLRQMNLAGKNLKNILEDYSLECVLSEGVRDNKLLVFLLRRGYIDEKYANYINYFKGTSVTKDDMNFIISVKNQAPLAFDYSLTKTKMVITRLQDHEFKERAIYNYDILEELLLHGPNSKLEILLIKLSDDSQDSWRFIDSFVDRTDYVGKFICLLAGKWNGMWDYISANETLSYDRKLLYLRNIISGCDGETIKEQNDGNNMTLYFERNSDILQQLESCNSSKIINAIKILNVHFKKLDIENVSPEVLDYVFDNLHYNLNDEMIKTIVAYKNKEVLDELRLAPFTTVIKLGYSSLTNYIHEYFEDYIVSVVLKQELISDMPNDVVAMLKRLKGKDEIQIQLIEKENLQLDFIEECAGEEAEIESEIWKPVWNKLLESNRISTNWKNVVSYWDIYGLTKELIKYVSLHADELSVMNAIDVDDELKRNLITSELSAAVKNKLIPNLKMNSFNLQLSELDDAILKMMIACNYFEFSVEKYKKIAQRSYDMSLTYILRNQDRYMELREQIPMSVELFESLMLSDGLNQEFKKVLFIDYADSFITEKIALKSDELGLPISKELFWILWENRSEANEEKLLLNNIKLLNADELKEIFREIGGDYDELTDRSRRHDVVLSSSVNNKALAQYLQDIEYITSFEEKVDKEVDAISGEEVGRKVLKLRVKAMK